MPNFDLTKLFSAQIAEARRFHLQLRRHHPKRLAVVSGGIERCSTDYQIHRNRFPYFGLEFVAGGRGRAVLGQTEGRLVPGTVFSYGPRTPHHIVTDPSEPLVKYFVDFTGNAARRLLGEVPLAPGCAAQTSAPAEVMPIFDELIRNGLRNSAHSPRICAALLEALLAKLAETQVPLGSVESPAFETYQRCRRELEQHALSLDSLQQLAERCHVDVAYLCRLFKRFDSESPYQRLMRLKMSHAAARLQAPGTLVKQVAAEFGFSDPYHFSRAFKSVFGVSPTHLVREKGRA
jgi:AraC-like DNA-binding protein